MTSSITTTHKKERKLTCGGGGDSNPRNASEDLEEDARRRAEGQRLYLKTLSAHLDLAVLASEDMWC